MSSPPNPLSAAALTAFQNGIQTVINMFFTMPVQINRRVAALDPNGESTVLTSTPYSVNALYLNDVGSGGRYHTIEHTDEGQVLHDEWKIYFQKSAVDALLTVDPEADSITLPSGKEYEIRMWTPSADFSTLGFILYECHIRFPAGA